MRGHMSSTQIRIQTKFPLTLPGGTRAPPMGLSAIEAGGSCPVYPSRVGVVGDETVSPRIEWGRGNDTLTGLEGDVEVLYGVMNDSKGSSVCMSAFDTVPLVTLSLITLSSSPSSKSRSSPFAHRALADIADFDFAVP